MLDTYTVSFFGHRQLDDLFAVEKELERIIARLLIEKEYVEFLVGRSGDIDQLVSSVVRRCKRSVRDDNSALVLVLPYETAEYRDNERAFYDYYDEIEIYDGTHFKSVFQARNQSMVDRSQLVVFCVERKHGGAFQTMQYAEKRQVHFINLRQVE